MIVVPVVNPLTTPDTEPTVAMEGTLLVQVPPLIVLDRVTGVPVQKFTGPVIVPAEGKEVTVTARVSVAVPQEFVTV